MDKQRGMVEITRDVKSGKMKLADVPSGIRPQVQRLLPVIGEHTQAVNYRTMDRGPMLRRARLG